MLKLSPVSHKFFISTRKKYFLGALSGSTRLFHSLFNTRHVFIPKFSISLCSLLCNLHTSTTAADRFSPKTCNFTYTLYCLRLKWINSSFTCGKVFHLKCFSRERQILKTEPERGLSASLSHFQVWCYAQLLRTFLTSFCYYHLCEVSGFQILLPVQNRRTTKQRLSQLFLLL